MAGEQAPGGQFMHHYRQRLSYWGRFFETVAQEPSETQKNHAIGEMDSLWEQRGRMDVDYFVSGDGLWTETIHECQLEDDTPEENILNRYPPKGRVTVVRYGIITGVWGRSEGFSVTKFPEAPQHELTYQFLREDDFGGRDPLLDIKLRHHIQIKLGTLSLVPVWEVEQKLEALDPKYGPASRKDLWGARNSNN